MKKIVYSLTAGLILFFLILVMAPFTGNHDSESNDSNNGVSAVESGQQTDSRDDKVKKSGSEESEFIEIEFGLEANFEERPNKG